jgi:hypothetical protein
LEKKKIIFIVSGIILFTGIGFYLGLPKDQPTQTSDETKLKAVEKKSADSSIEPPSNQPIVTSAATPTKKEKLSYKDELFSDHVVKSLKIKTQLIFKNYPFAEDISDWMAIGVVMDSSQNFGEIYLGTLSKLNKNPEEVLGALKKEVKGLDEKDSFVRNMFLNLAHNLNVSDNEKRRFFGSEFARKIKLDDKGNFTEDSMNITNSMALFKQHAKSDEDALEYSKKAMDLNRGNPQMQKELLIRIKSYFPKIVDELTEL